MRAAIPVSEKIRYVYVYVQAEDRAYYYHHPRAEKEEEEEAIIHKTGR